MTVDEFEQSVIQAVEAWSFIDSVAILDKTAHAIKMRLMIDPECFVQIYANVQKGLISYALILSRLRIYGRDSDGGVWHRHPYPNSEDHDFSPEGSREVSLQEFLAEVQQILQGEEIL
jgi:hypothetical protein